MPECLYRLSIAPELAEFRPEIEHVCGFLDSSYQVRRMQEAERVLHYGPDAPRGAVTVPAALFPSGMRVDANGLHPSQNELARMASRPDGGIRPAASDGVDASLRYDAIGLIFFMLSRLEEREHPSRDRYGRFPVTAALFQPENGRLYPHADRAARDLAAALTGAPEPPLRTRYALKVTHDVDVLRGYHRPLEPLRNAAGDIVKRGRPIAALRRLFAAYGRGEPWRSMRRLMYLSEQHGIQSHFYFMGPSSDFMDSTYAMRWPKLMKQVSTEIHRRGHVLGFHPGFHTYNDAAEWRRQRDGAESIMGHLLREGRHHVLRYDCAVTPRIWSDGGMALDCTLAYPEVVGFRSGTCRPHHAFDLVARRTLPLMQISTAAMEFGLFDRKYRDVTLEQALADSFWSAQLCREFGGTFVVLFHSGQAHAKLWKWYERVLQQATQ